MTPKIKAKIKFCKFEGAIAYQVEYRDDRFRYFDTHYYDNGSEKVDISPEGGLWINTDPDVPIHDGERYLPYMGIGLSLTGPSNSVQYSTSTAPDADVKLLVSALIHWAKNWEGWKGEPAITPIIEEFPNGVVELTV